MIYSSRKMAMGKNKSCNENSMSFFVLLGNENSMSYFVLLGNDNSMSYFVLLGNEQGMRTV